MNCLTIRSSSEWKLITASRPPGAEQRGRRRERRARAPSSSLTAIRSAWKARVAGCRRPRRRPRAALDRGHESPSRAKGRPVAARRRCGPGGGSDAPRRSNRRRLPARTLVSLVQQVGRGGAVASVESHVERAGRLEGEAAGSDSANWSDDRPRSSSTPSHGAKPCDAATIRMVRGSRSGQGHSRSICSKPRRRPVDRRLVAIQPENPPARLARRQQGGGRPPPPSVPSIYRPSGRGAKAAMTSSSRTARCSLVTPRPSAPATAPKVPDLVDTPLEKFAPRALPGRPVPDFDPIEDARDNDLGPEPGVASAGTAVRRFGRACPGTRWVAWANRLRWTWRASALSQDSPAMLFGGHLPGLGGQDVQAAVDPGGQVEPVGQLGPKAGRDGQTSLVVDGVLVLSEEH